jgi:hypothetical protein
MGRLILRDLATLWSRTSPAVVECCGCGTTPLFSKGGPVPPHHAKRATVMLPHRSRTRPGAGRKNLARGAATAGVFSV